MADSYLRPVVASIDKYKLSPPSPLGRLVNCWEPLLPAIRHASRRASTPDSESYLSTHAQRCLEPNGMITEAMDFRFHSGNQFFFHAFTLSTQSKDTPAVSSAATPMATETTTETMSPSTPMAPEPTKKKPLDISSLMSPPEPNPFETFHQASPLAMKRPVTAEEKRPSGAPLSPPISPFTKNSHSVETSPAGSKDPILYPNSDVSSSPPAPLFNADETAPPAERAIEKHVTARPDMFTETTPPRRGDYELALFFKSSVMEQYSKNPRAWLRKEREQLEADRRASSAFRYNHRPHKHVVPAARTPSALRPAPTRIAKSEKPKRTIRATPQRIAPQTNGAPPRQSGVRVPSATPEPRRTVAPNREDKDFRDRPDYCPPLSTLPNKSNSLKVDWKGNALDLSQDPHRDLLHPDELTLAANLRLDCATYLTSKRRIFERRLECARKHKEFRKTDAQQACKIDVNKASKLWTAYDKVGWLNLSHMERFMN